MSDERNWSEVKREICLVSNASLKYGSTWVDGSI